MLMCMKDVYGQVSLVELLKRSFQNVTILKATFESNDYLHGPTNGKKKLTLNRK